jgi:hypothetical protein
MHNIKIPLIPLLAAYSASKVDGSHVKERANTFQNLDNLSLLLEGHSLQSHHSGARSEPGIRA